MLEDEIRSRLAKLRPDVPWAHHFDLGYGITTIQEDNEHYFRKSRALHRFAELMISTIAPQIWRDGFTGKRVLDLASAEGGHAIAYAQAGAREVIGVEGRQLHVDRANFVAEALGVENVSFRQGDVRKLSVEDLGTFDCVVCCGILYHIEAEHFMTVIRSLYELSTDASVIFSHVAVPYNLSVLLPAPVKTPGGYEGYLFREHQDEDDSKTKIERHRYSLDNVTSFWPTPSELYRAVHDAGFKRAWSQVSPHSFEAFDQIEGRPILILSK